MIDNIINLQDDNFIDIFNSHFSVYISNNVWGIIALILGTLSIILSVWQRINLEMIQSNNRKKAFIAVTTYQTATLLELFYGILIFIYGYQLLFSVTNKSAYGVSILGLFIICLKKLSIYLVNNKIKNRIVVPKSSKIST
jgi:uncharacterized membrane protein HdeD (DUF308 family)